MKYSVRLKESFKAAEAMTITERSNFSKRTGGSKNTKKIVLQNGFSDKLKLQPVVQLGKKVATGTASNEVQPTLTDCCVNMQPIVLLEKLSDEAFNFHANSENKMIAVPDADKYNCTQTIDCLADLHRRSLLLSSSPKESSDGWSHKLQSQDIKVSQLEMKPYISIPVITQLLVDAVTLGNAPSRHNRPFDLANPSDECDAIVEALAIYAACVPPEESVYLFYNGSHLQNNLTLDRAEINICYDWNNVESGEDLKIRNIQPWSPSHFSRRQQVRKREPKKKGWSYLTTLSSSDFFFKMKLTPRGRETFERKMLAIMKTGLGVDPHNWTMSEVGYILGYWLAKLYNAQEIPDENLPKELVLTKEHFLEMHGLNYNDVIVITSTVL